MTNAAEGDRPAEGSGDARARAKVRSIEELASIADEVRASGRTVVLCHGVFDLVHLGHVRHLEAAAREGDVVMVTVTADAHVHKGPGRPIFPAQVRAEMLAALGSVQWVGIVDSPSAIPAIEAIKPAAYVKGGDYENPDDDVTGKIVPERQAVERHGGRLVFTQDVTYSSSSLINKYLDVFDPSLRDYLDAMRRRDAHTGIVNLIDSVKDFRVLIVGDAILDEYQYVAAMGKSSKEHMIATRFGGAELFAGGVFAAANHVAGFCSDVEIITVLGEDDSREDFIRKNLKPNVILNPLYKKDAPTTRKCRFVDPDYVRKLFEVYFINDSPPDEGLEKRLISTIKRRAPKFDLVIVTDFGHGMITEKAIQAILANARFVAVNTQTNSANYGFNLVDRYARADYICIDVPEARLAAADQYGDVPTIIQNELAAKVDCPHIIITHGRSGCFTFDGSRARVNHIPAFTKSVVDTVGAGDAFLAVTSPLVAAGGNIEDIGFVGNAVGAIKVGIVGHRESVEKPHLLKFITTLLK